MKDFEKLFQEYSVETDETIINDKIEKILTQTPLNHNINTILYGCLDYTSLNCTDNEDHINKMVEHINNNIKTDVICHFVSSSLAERTFWQKDYVVFFEWVNFAVNRIFHFAVEKDSEFRKVDFFRLNFFGCLTFVVSIKNNFHNVKIML